jgi:hypothetical protein
VAHDVRAQLLDDVADVRVKLCTEVTKLERAADSSIEVRRCWLGKPSSWPHRATSYDRVLVATGFPAEPRVADVHGGTYWHALDGLEALHGDVHVIGDGDGALTEVLMLLIDRYGHGAVEVLCAKLRLERSGQGSRLRRALTGLALATRRMLLRDPDQRDDDQRRADEHTVWMLMTAAAAELGTLSGRGVVALRPSARYLTAEWATEALRLQDETAGGERPGWADGLAERAAGLQEQPPSVGAFRAFARERAEQAYLETPWGARVTLADFGVWPAELGRHHLSGEDG